jgi:Xaa-Pro aminopeptidase
MPPTDDRQLREIGATLRQRRGDDYEDVRFSNSEYERRYQAIREEMFFRGLDCLVVYGSSAHTDSNQANIRYLSGYIDQIQSYIVFPYEGEPTLYADLYPHVPDAHLMSYIGDVRWGTENKGRTIVERIRELGYEDGNIGFVGSPGPAATELPANDYLTITNALGDADFSFVSDLMDRIRLKKSDEEVEAIREGVRLTDKAMRALEEAARPGITERELKRELMSSYLDEGEYFFQLLGSTSMDDPDMPYPWEHQSNRTIQNGDIILTEISARNPQGYSGQILRGIAVGEDPIDHFTELYDVAEQVFYDILDVLEPGATTEDVLAAATPPIESRDWTVHAPIIHGWGLGIQRPLIGTENEGGFPNPPFEFEEGHTIVVEPNPVATDQMSGMFLGELVRITSDGVERLHEYPMEFIQT